MILGWDERWGTPMGITAASSGSTGTVCPFGPDCSGGANGVVITGAARFTAAARPDCFHGA